MAKGILLKFKDDLGTIKVTIHDVTFDQASGYAMTLSQRNISAMFMLESEPRFAMRSDHSCQDRISVCGQSTREGARLPR